MGFIGLSNGETVHTIMFDPNPVMEIITLSREFTDNKIITRQIYRYKNGTQQEIEMTATINFTR